MEDMLMLPSTQPVRLYVCGRGSGLGTLGIAITGTHCMYLLLFRGSLTKTLCMNCAAYVYTSSLRKVRFR